MVAEVVCNPFDNLPRFVSFAGNDEYITGFEFGDCLLDSLGTVADVDTFGTGRQNFGADNLGLFGAGIVICDIHHIGKVVGYFAHDRAFAFVSVAAAAKEDSKLSGAMRT